MSDIIGIGVDIEEIQRFEDKLDDKHFLGLIFTNKELEYCMAKEKPSQHLAARFAGKEAAIKALSKVGVPLSMKQIEILKSDHGEPFIILHKEEYSNYQCKISLSHSLTAAVGFVLCFK